MKRFVPEALRGGKRMRWILSAALAAMLLIGVVGVAVTHFRSGTTALANVTLKASTCADAYKVMSLRPSQITAANSVCLVQNLKFTGELTGLVSQAYPVSADNTGPSAGCAVPKRWNGYPPAVLAMVIGSKAYRLRISPPGSSKHEAMTINNLAQVVELAMVGNPSSDWSQATGSVTVNPDGITGAIDANLLRDVAGAHPVHVTGQWACGVPQPLPSVDATVPCSSFYTLNHLADADVARMQAAACNAQNLTISGDITAHLDHAITDTAFPGPPGMDGDNHCDNAGNQYNASLKFSIGDETFLLVLNPHSDSYRSSVGPGPYAAGAGLFSANAFLWLGHADPSRNGRFVSDGGISRGVSWYGSAGSFTIGSDMKSGTIDETFQGLSVNHASSAVRITGKWRCAT
jgi:hypothetical protein